MRLKFRICGGPLALLKSLPTIALLSTVVGELSTIETHVVSLEHTHADGNGNGNIWDAL